MSYRLLVGSHIEMIKWGEKDRGREEERREHLLEYNKF